MTIRDLGDLPGGEGQLAAGQMPKPNERISTPGNTPGVALAGARPPVGPTVPDWDPASLTLAISRYANEIFAEPPTASAPEPAVPSASAPQTSSASPFSAGLSFDHIGDGYPALPTFSLLDTAPEAIAPPTPDTRKTPPETSIAVPASPFVWTTGPFAVEPATHVEAPHASSGTSLDPHAVRRQFPILNERVNGKRLVWLDNAATTQKPERVIDRLSYFYEHENSNIHRAAHTLAARATDAYEGARESVRRFIGAGSKNEIIFVRGATEGINFLANTWARANLREGDEILVSNLEHHANIVPWQLLCAERGLKLKVAPVDDSGQILLNEYARLLGPRTRLVSFTQVSNALGTITPAPEMIAMAHRHGAKVVLDGAQGVSHMPVNVQALDCDFYVFSGHKVFAPTGIGVVFGKAELLESMPPWQGGGNMIQDVTFERTVYQGIPNRFEAGTGNIADAVGLGAALDWLAEIGIEKVGAYEHALLEYGTAQLATVPGLRMIGTAHEKAGVLSFVLAGQKTEEVGGLLDKEGIAVRSGHHCAQPILRRFGVEATVRASLAPYNTHEDIDALVAALRRLQSGHRT